MIMIFYYGSCKLNVLPYTRDDVAGNDTILCDGRHMYGVDVSTYVGIANKQ